jgi:glycosyltransferase involved in cell wall biosynthesis
LLKKHFRSQGGTVSGLCLGGWHGAAGRGMVRPRLRRRLVVSEAGLGERGQDAGALLRAGDAARDARRWAEAAAQYGAYLELRPDDRGILIQRGHCVKEAGDPAAALILYRRAEAIEPGEPDIHLQIGHALKLMGRAGLALEAYGRALALDPLARDPWEEWRALSSRAPAPPRQKGLVLDLSDLVAWFGKRRAPSGIQRVQVEVATEALDRAALCVMRPGKGGWRALPAPLFHRLRALSRAGADMTEPAWLDALEALESWLGNAPALRFGPGSVLVTIGSAWWLPQYGTALRAARAEGMRHVALLHDCGPLTMPDTVEPAARQEFARWFATLPVRADGIIAVSKATAAEYRRLMAQHLPGWPAPPVAVVTPDGHTALPDAADEAAPAVASGMLGALGLRRATAGQRGGAAHPALLPGEPYVLLVSSLEPRKNHALAFAAWTLLLARRGARNTPRLVLAGRRVPGDEATLALLEADTALAGHVTLLHDLDDAALARLYRDCLFTLYPSRHEGWGLPVSESLGQGRVPVVSEVPALMESGRNGAVFFAPGSAEDLATVAEGLIADPSRLAAAAARIPPGGGLRPWSEVTAELLAATRRLADRAADEGEGEPPVFPLLEPVPFGHGDAAQPRPSMALAEAVIRGEGWHEFEDWGLWARPGYAEIRLHTRHDAPLRLAISLRPAPRAEGVLRLILSRDGAPDTVLDLPASIAGETALEIGAGGPELRLMLDSPRGTRLPDGREVGVGLTALGLMRGASLPDRIAFLEARTLVPLVMEG